MTSAGELLRDARRRHGLTQARLALRAGTTQAAISRIERGESSPSVETLQRLLLAMGERLELASARMETEYDPVHMAAELRLDAARRLDRAFEWIVFAGELRGKAHG